jgi:hypothetical protein
MKELNKEQQRLPKEVCVAIANAGTNDEYLNCGKIYADVAAESANTEVGIYRLQEIVTVSTLAKPILRTPVKHE